MDWNTTVTCPGDPGALEHVLWWLLHPQWGGGGVVLIYPKGDQLLYVIGLHFHATNNVVEYEALVNDLHITVELRVQWLYICSDPELVVNQVMGESNCHDSSMAAYHQEVWKLEEKFDSFALHHILQHDNEVADTLAQHGSS
jgi:ribonuclease HI